MLAMGPPKRVLINPVVRWATEPGHPGTLDFVDGVADGTTTLPYVGDVLTLPFIVNPITRQPCPVRVTRIEYVQEPGRTVVIPVVVRASQG